MYFYTDLCMITAFVRNYDVINIISQLVIESPRNKNCFNYFEVLHPMHFHALDVSSVTPTKCTLFYLLHMSSAVGLRQCATTRRKVAGSIPYGVTGIFHCHNPSGPLWPWG